MGSHELLPMGRRSFPMWSVPFHMGTDVPWGYLMWKWPYPWGSHGNAHHPLWLTWDGLYPTGKVFISHGILFPCETPSHVKNLLSVWNIFPWEIYSLGKSFPRVSIYPRGKVSCEIFCHAMKAKKDSHLKITYNYAYYSFNKSPCSSLVGKSWISNAIILLMVIYFARVTNISHEFVLSYSHGEEIDISHREWKLSDVISLPMGTEFLTWGTSISLPMRPCRPYERRKSKETSQRTQHAKSPCEVFRLTWERTFPWHVTQVIPWGPENVLIGDCVSARCRPRNIWYFYSACSTWSKTSLTLHESDNIQISKISTPTFNKVIRAYLQGVDHEWLHILTQ